MANLYPYQEATFEEYRRRQLVVVTPASVGKSVSINWEDMAAAEISRVLRQFVADSDRMAHHEWGPRTVTQSKHYSARVQRAKAKRR